MPVKSGKPKGKQSSKKQQQQPEQQPITRITTILHLEEWDVEAQDLKYGKSGIAYCQVKLSGENNLTYYATAFGEFAEALANEDYDKETVIVEVGYDKTLDGKIKGYKLFLRDGEDLPF